MKRRAAIRAKFRAQMIHAHPGAARTAFGVDALNRPTGQVLQRLPLKFACEKWRFALAKSWADCAAGGLWCQEQSNN
jgi:hypothetical protein